MTHSSHCGPKLRLGTNPHSGCRAFVFWELRPKRPRADESKTALRHRIDGFFERASKLVRTLRTRFVHTQRLGYWPSPTTVGALADVGLAYVLFHEPGGGGRNQSRTPQLVGAPHEEAGIRYSQRGIREKSGAGFRPQHRFSRWIFQCKQNGSALWATTRTKSLRVQISLKTEL